MPGPPSTHSARQPHLCPAEACLGQSQGRLTTCSSAKSRKVPGHGCHSQNVPCAQLEAALVTPVSAGVGWSPELRCWEGSCNILSQGHGELTMPCLLSESDMMPRQSRPPAQRAAQPRPRPAEVCQAAEHRATHRALLSRCTRECALWVRGDGRCSGRPPCCSCWYCAEAKLRGARVEAEGASSSWSRASSRVLCWGESCGSLPHCHRLQAAQMRWCAQVIAVPGALMWLRPPHCPRSTACRQLR